MKILGALALAIAVPTLAQTAPAADPHAAHAQHHATAKPGTAGQGHAGMDHAQMMAKCKDPAASAEIKAHCAMMMKEHGQPAPDTTQPKADHSGHAH